MGCNDWWGDVKEREKSSEDQIIDGMRKHWHRFNEQRIRTAMKDALEIALASGMLRLGPKREDLMLAAATAALLTDETRARQPRDGTVLVTAKVPVNREFVAEVIRAVEEQAKPGDDK
jgi:hypothetical protein